MIARRTSLREKIYSLALQVESLTAQNFAFKEMPQDTTGTYGVFSEINNQYAGRTTMSKFEESHVQFAFYGENQKELETLAKNIRSKFDDAESSFTLSDYYVLRIDWTLTRDVQLEDVKQIVIQYKFSLQQK